MTEPQKLIRVELGDTEILKPCEKHAERGYQTTCDDCDAAPMQPASFPALEGYFAEFRNPNLLTYGETKRILNRGDDESFEDYKERVVASLLTAWNCVDAESGDELALPTADDHASFDRVVDPGAVDPVYVAIVKARRERAVPKASTTSS